MMIKKNKLYFLLLLSVPFILNGSLLYAGNDGDASSAFFSGDVGTDGKAITRMLETDSGGIMAPGSLKKGFVVCKTPSLFSDSNRVIFKKTICEIENGYKVYLYENKNETPHGEVNVKFTITGSGAIQDYTILATTLNNKKIESYIRAGFEKSRFKSACKKTVTTIKLTFYCNEKK
jgi:hypothetical protein